MNLGPLSIGQPWVLLGWLLCPLLVLAMWRSRIVMPRWLHALAGATRVACAALVVLAMADARLLAATRRLAVAYLVDGSTSVSAVEQRATRARFGRVADDHRRITWIPVRAPGPASATNLEDAIWTAAGLLPTDRVRRVVLATDGRETRGDVLAAADAARRAGLEVSVLPLGNDPPVDLVAAQGLEIPRLVRAAQPLTVGVRVLASRATTGRIDLLRDGEPLASVTVPLAAGVSLHDLPVEFPQEGVHTLEARVGAAGDLVATNNAWRSLVRVVSPPRVLLVHEQTAAEPVLARVFRDAHLRVELVQAPAVPDSAPGMEPFQLVVLDEMQETTLSEGQQRALRAWVEQRAGGLVTVTGSYGVGRDPEVLRAIEPLLPPRAIPEPRPLELVLVIDRSGSMSGAPIANARAAGIAAIHALRPDSRVGAVAFSGAVDRTVAPVPMAQAEEVVQFVSGIYAGGGTDIASALRGAAGLISRDERYLHHVILLSDGESDLNPAIAAAQQVVATGASISTITLGPRNELMAAIARIGRGRYHVTSSPTSLPALFVREAQYRQPPPGRDRPFRPTVVHRRTFLDGVDLEGGPPLGGFTLADLRPGAEVVLATPEAGPLLAHWYVGQGQVASFTSATSGRWSNEWRTGPAFRRLFSQMAWELLRPPSDETVELHLDAAGADDDHRRLTVLSTRADSEQEPRVSLWRGPTGAQPVALRVRGPGIREAILPLGTGFVVDARIPGRREPVAAVGADAPYPREQSAFGSDGQALAAIAAAGGGRVLRDADAAAQVTRSARVLMDLRLSLLVAALLCYLAGLLLLRMPDRAWSRGTRTSSVSSLPGAIRASMLPSRPPAKA